MNLYQISLSPIIYLCILFEGFLIRFLLVYILIVIFLNYSFTLL